MPRLLSAMMAALMTLAAAPAFAAAILMVESTHGAAEFSRTDLQALPQVTFNTSTEFTDGAPEFSGPLIRDVLAAAGVQDGSVVVLTAANDYSIEVPMEELTKYGVILATTMDGRHLSMRDKGPIWVMYPLDHHAELSDPVFNNRLIWQTVRIQVK